MDHGRFDTIARALGEHSPSRRGAIKLLAGAAFLLGWNETGGTAAARLRRRYCPLYRWEIVQDCQPGGQLCTPSWSTPFAYSGGRLFAEFRVAPQGCSDMVLYIQAGGTRTGFGPLAPGESTGQVDLLSLGVEPLIGNTITLQGQGVVGGCSTGHLSQWGGTFTISIRKKRC